MTLYVRFKGISVRFRLVKRRVRLANFDQGAVERREVKFEIIPKLRQALSPSTHVEEIAWGPRQTIGQCFERTLDGFDPQRVIVHGLGIEWLRRPVSHD